MDEVDVAIINDENNADLILFKANNLLEEIFLRTQLRIQVAKNELISNLEEDLEDTLEVTTLEDNIADFKEKSYIVITTLEGKIATEKDELKEKYGEE